MKLTKTKTHRTMASVMPIRIADAFAQKCKRNDTTVSRRLRRLVLNDLKKEIPNETAR